jgi:hypothetical protein
VRALPFRYEFGVWCRQHAHRPNQAHEVCAQTRITERSKRRRRSGLCRARLFPNRPRWASWRPKAPDNFRIARLKHSRTFELDLT